MNLARLRDAMPVAMIEPVPYEKVRGLGFYRQFLDNREWPEFMRAGRTEGLRALESIVKAPALDTRRYARQVKMISPPAAIS